MKMIAGFCSRAMVKSCFTRLIISHESCCYIPFGFSHPFADEVTRTDTEERTLGLGRDGLCKETLSGTRRTVKKDTAPGCSLPCEKLRKLDRQDDCFF